MQIAERAIDKARPPKVTDAKNMGVTRGQRVLPVIIFPAVLARPKIRTVPKKIFLTISLHFAQKTNRN